MANGPLLTEIRIPLVMTTDASRAVRGMQQARAQLSKIGEGLKGWGAGQISGLGGMLSGYLGIQGALSGIRMLMDESERLRGISAKWSPTAAKARAETQVVEMKSERVVAEALVPQALAGEERLQREAAIAASPIGISAAAATAEAGGAMSEIWGGAMNELRATLLAASGDFQNAVAIHAVAAAQFERGGAGRIVDPTGVFAMQGRAIEDAAMARLNTSNEQIARNTGGTR